MSNIIFYSSGMEAREKLPLWQSVGLTPVCFVDADKNKHYTYFISDGNNAETKVEILPLMEAIRCGSFSSLGTE